MEPASLAGRRRCGTCVALLMVLVLQAVAAARGDVIRLDNADLADGTRGWLVTTQGWSAAVETSPDDGARMLRFSGARDHGIFLRELPMQKYRGHLLRLSTRVRVTPEMQGMVWARVDRDDGEPGCFDNMADRPVEDTTWTDVEMYVAVDGHAAKLTFGGMCFGAGTADFRPLVLEDLGPHDGVDHGRAPRLSAGAVERLAATAELLGVVRWFHPEPALLKLDWDAFTVHAVDRVLAVSSDAELVAALRELLAPVAPEVQLFAARHPPPPTEPGTPAADAFVTAWEHTGYGPEEGFYASKLHQIPVRGFEQRRARPDDVCARLAALGEVWEAELGAGLGARVPLTLVRSAEQLDASPGWSPDVPGLRARMRLCDRSTRLASVITLWASMRQFYPYFDVVDVDWSAQLGPALRAAFEAPGINAQLGVLRELSAALHDGHVGVSHSRSARLAHLPVLWEWLDDELVVTAVHPTVTELAVGDVVERIAGEPAGLVLERLEARESAATPAHRRRRALNVALWGPPDERVELRVRHGSRASTLELPYGDDAAREPRPEPVSDLGDGLVYADLTRLDSAAWTVALPRLAAADGVVLDMRGYPGGIGAQELFAPLVGEVLSSPQWHVPHFTRPGNAPAQYSSSAWNVAPGGTRVEAPLVFLMDERAISYAETCLGIVEAYELGARVGHATAGTNGNVASVWLPGGFRVAFTGMRVLKHDGSPHHGVGILPTHPVSRTRKGVAAGRDELIEAAVALLRGGR